MLAGQQCLSCYERLDQKLTEKIVPWVRYLSSYATQVTSSNVTQWSFDQFGGSIGDADVAVQ